MLFGVFNFIKFILFEVIENNYVGYKFGVVDDLGVRKVYVFSYYMVSILNIFI